jgi:hypothetical protein
MSGVLQIVVVTVLVVACALYSTWRLLSARLRLRLLELLGRLPGIGSSAWLLDWRARLSGGAGGCGACPAGATRAPSRKQTPGALRR